MGIGAMRIILISLSLFLASTCSAAVSIPVTIAETVPTGVSGIALTSEPVTVGVPLPSNSGVTAISQLGLSGASVGQFRVLKRHPNNAIWWVLVDTQASVTAGGTATVTLTDSGSGNFGGSDLASETASTITVATGGGTFTVSKTAFNLLDTAVVSGTTMISTGNSGEVRITIGGTTYSSANSAATVSIEENGPVRAVVKATGRLTSSGAVNNCGYTIRMHFYKDKAFVKYDAEVSNGYADATSVVTLTDARMKQPTTLSGTLSYNIGYNASSSATGTLSTSTWGYQGNSGSYGDRSPDTGIQINNGGSDVRALGTSSDYLRGSGYISTTGKSVGVGIAQLRINEPSGFEFYSDGVVDLSWASRHMTTGITLKAGQHILLQSYLDFATSAHTAENLEHRTQYPLMGRCSLATYNAAGGIYGIDLVEVQAERDFFTANSRTFPEANIENILREHVNRNYGWSTSGTPNSDWNLKYLMDYLRTGNGALYNSAMQGAINSAVTATIRSDDFNYYSAGSVPTIGSGWGSSFDDAHTYWEGQAYLYLVSGNEFIKDSMVDFGEQWERYIKANEYRSFYVLNYHRNWTRSYRNQAILAWVLESSHYTDNVNTMTELLFVSPDTDATHRNGMNFERGYMHAANGGDLGVSGVDSEFMNSKLVPETFKTVAFLMGTGWHSYEILNDLVSGSAKFIYGEFYGETGPDCGDFGYVYKYNIDTSNSSFVRAKQSEVVLVHEYFKTGNSQYLDRAKKIFFADVSTSAECPDGSPWGPTVASELGAHALVKAASTTATATYVGAVGGGLLHVAGSSVTNNGDGTYSVSITVPSAGTGYQVKFSPQQIVDNLGFNQSSRTYSYAPANYDNYWAALNMTTEPAKGTVGQTQVITVDVEQEIADYNTRYGLTSGDAGYQTYSGGTYYFSVGVFAQGSSLGSGRFGGNGSARVTTGGNGLFQ